MVFPAAGLPLLLVCGLRVAAVPPALYGNRWHEVQTVRTDGAKQLVALSAVSSLGQAHELVKCWLLASEADLPTNLAWHDASRLVGREVADERLGALGHIEEVLEGPANDVWVVRGPYGEVLLPAVPEIVCDLPDVGPVCVVAPHGLIPGDQDTDSERATS